MIITFTVTSLIHLRVTKHLGPSGHLRQDDSVLLGSKLRFVKHFFVSVLHTCETRFLHPKYPEFFTIVSLVTSGLKTLLFTGAF